MDPTSLAKELGRSPIQVHTAYISQQKDGTNQETNIGIPKISHD